VAALIERLGPELLILERLPVEAISAAGFPEIAEAVALVRRGQIAADPGFDGEYGTVHVADPRRPTAPVT
jgi:DNA helicase-2/ATP-dependent DNA helicase PcrA